MAGVPVQHHNISIDVWRNLAPSRQVDVYGINVPKQRRRGRRGGCESMDQ